jgi:hypothetical protein
MVSPKKNAAHVEYVAEAAAARQPVAAEVERIEAERAAALRGNTERAADEKVAAAGTEAARVDAKKTADAQIEAARVAAKEAAVARVNARLAADAEAARVKTRKIALGLALLSLGVLGIAGTHHAFESAKAERL